MTTPYALTMPAYMHAYSTLKKQYDEHGEALYQTWCQWAALIMSGQARASIAPEDRERFDEKLDINHLGQFFTAYLGDSVSRVGDRAYEIGVNNGAYDTAGAINMRHSRQNDVATAKLLERCVSTQVNYTDSTGTSIRRFAFFDFTALLDFIG